MHLRLASPLLAVLIFTTFGFGPRLRAQERHPSDLTANDLAETLGVHWWTVKLPGDIGPKDMVGVELVSSDGKVLGGPSGFSGGGFGDKLQIFCWEDEASQQMKVTIKLTNGGTATDRYKDYFKDASIGGAANGSVLNVGDILLKFDASKSPSFTGGNILNEGQIGLKVVITRRS